MHLRLMDGKVLIEQDWTDDFVADLLDAGVSREDLVFALSTPPEHHSETERVAA